MTNSRNICSALVIITLSYLSYFNSFANSFHFDDFRYILNNEAFKEYIDNPFSIHQTFTSLSNRSIVLATLYLNHYFGGFNVLGFHAVNLIIHILTSFLVFLFIKELLTFNQNLKVRQIPPSPHFVRVEKRDYKINIPLIASLIFSVHPVNTQAVTYISGRSSLLATCFYLGSFLFFLKGFRQRLLFNKLLLFIISVILFIAGYGSKIIIFTAPIMAVIYSVCFISQNSYFPKTPSLSRLFNNRVLRITIQGIVLTSPLILIFLSKYISLQSIIDVDREFLPGWLQPIHLKFYHVADFTKDVISSQIYLLTEFKVIVFYYIRIILFPFNQNIDPDFPLALGIIDYRVILSLCIIELCLFAGIYYQKKNRLIAFGIFWFFVTLLPTSSIFPLLDTVAEHRIYLPFIGIVLIISFFINHFISSNKNISLSHQITYFILTIFSPIIIFSTLTAKRNFVWENGKSLWLDAAEKSPRLARPLNNLGLAYDKEKDYEKAIQVLNKAVSIFPDNYKSYNNLGNIYGKLQKHELAMENLKLALEKKPDYPIGHYNLGKIYELKGMLDSAIEEYSIAIKQKYDFFEACFNLANVYDKKEQFQQALKTYLNCEKFKSDFPKIHFAIGKIFIKTGNIDKASDYFSRAIELDKNYNLAKIAMGNIFVMKGDFDEAEKIFRQILKSDPNNFNTHNNLGMLFLQQLNNPPQAVYHFKKSLEINPEQQKADLLRKLTKNFSSRSDQ